MIVVGRQLIFLVIFDLHTIIILQFFIVIISWKTYGYIIFFSYAMFPQLPYFFVLESIFIVIMPIGICLALWKSLY